jgi:hypothetical protein
MTTTPPPDDSSPTENVLPHPDEFSTFNDIVMFPVANQSLYPHFTDLLLHGGLYTTLNVSSTLSIDFPMYLKWDDAASTASFVVLVRPLDGEIVERGTFDSLTRYIGDIAIWDSTSRSLHYVDVIGDLPTKRHLLDVLRAKMTDDSFSITINIKEPHLRTIVGELVDYGFGDPKLSASGDILTLKYFRRIERDETIARVDALISELRDDVHTIKMIFPRALASTLSAYVRHHREMGGALSIGEYDDAGRAILSLNSENVVEGDVHSVTKPRAFLTLVQFHTHPEHPERSMPGQERYLSWPSGSDVAHAIPMFLSQFDKIVEFVAAAEGIWFIHMTIDFQRLLLDLRGRPWVANCRGPLYEAVKEIYEITKLGTHIPHLSRLSVDAYTERVNYITFSHLFLSSNKSLLNPLIARCAKFDRVHDFQLFHIGLIPWSAFRGGAVPITFTYILDVDGGQTAYIEPFSGPIDDEYFDAIEQFDADEDAWIIEIRRAAQEKRALERAKSARGP